MCFVQCSCTALNRCEVYRDLEEKDVIQKDVIPKIIKSQVSFHLFLCINVPLRTRNPSGCQKVPLLSIPFRHVMVSSEISLCIIRQDAFPRHPSCLAAIKPG